MNNADILELRMREAIAATRRGWVLTPLRGKIPIITGWHRQPTPDESTVMDWARHGNLGLRTGAISGVIVVDDDTENGGGIISLLGSPPRTPTVITGSGKRHYYFRAPDDCPKNSVGKLAPDVDVRSNGGQVVYVGSLHPDTGAPYQWAAGLSPEEAPLALMPKELRPEPTAERKRPNDATEKSRAHATEKMERYARAALERETQVVRDAVEGSRNDTLNRAAFSLGQLVVGGQLPHQTVEDQLLEAAMAIGLSVPEAKATIQSGLSAGSQHPRGPKHAPSDFLPAGTRHVEIVIRQKLTEITDQAEAALMSAVDGEVYVRGNMLVHVVRDGARRLRGLTRPLGAPVIVPADEAWLRERIDRAATWARYTRDGKKIPALPPVWVVKGLAARGEWPFPSLETVLETPCLRPDGTVVDRTGYDRETGLLFEPGGTSFPPILERPSQREAARALVDLFEPFQDFPFLAESDQAAAYAAVLTILARPAIAGPCPVFAFRAPTPGSGKSLLADTVSLIAAGRRAALMAPPRDSDEARKLVLAVGIEGTRVILIDNVSGAFGSEVLAAATTADTWSGRVLGVTKTATVPLRAVWMLTGNNVSFRGDLGRRVVPCDIDPRCDHPEDRSGFRHPDLRAHVSRNRPRFVAAALTALRAYYVAGCPPHGRPPKGSFENWDAIVRGTLIWLGAGDPLGGCARIREEADTDLDSLRQALGAWEEAFDSDPVTTAQAIQRATEKGCEDLGAAIAGLTGCAVSRLDPRRLGYALRRVRGRRVAGRFFEAGHRTRGGAKRWRVASEEDTK